VLPAGLDPADFLAGKAGQAVEEDAASSLAPALDAPALTSASGIAAMQQLVANAEPLLGFTINRRLANYDLKKPEQRQLALSESLKLLLPIRGSMLASDYLNYLADALGVNYETAAESFKRLRAPRLQPERSALATRTQASGAGTSDAASRTDAAGTTGAAGATGAAQAAAATATTAAREAEDPVAALERELLAHFIQYPELRDKLRGPLERVQWSSDLHQSVAQLLLSAAAGETSAQLSARLLDNYPQAAAILVASEDSADADAAYRQVLISSYSLRIKQLEREVRSKRLELERRSRGFAAQGAATDDELFREIKQRQDELVELRKHLSGLTVG
jgi:DNA primase